MDPSSFLATLHPPCILHLLHPPSFLHPSCLLLPPPPLPSYSLYLPSSGPYSFLFFIMYIFLNFHFSSPSSFSPSPLLSSHPLSSPPPPPSPTPPPSQPHW